MKRFALIGLVLVAGITARTEPEAASAPGGPFDENTAIELTAGLTQYENPPSLAGKVTSVGGGTSAILVNRWAAEFAQIYPGLQLDLHGGGSVSGLDGLVAGTVDLVPLNRPLPAADIARFKAKFGYEPTVIVVAQDAAAVYVNLHNPLAGLTLAQLDAIYSRDARRGGGRPEFWHELGVTGPLAQAQISRVVLSRVHSEHLDFQQVVMRGAEYQFHLRTEVVPSSLVQAVGADDAAVGFASMMFATARTRFVPLQAADGTYVLPTYENIVSGKYPLIRPVRVVFNRKPDGTMNPAAREFLRFAVSRRGQRIISLAGTFPITVDQQQEALRLVGEAPPAAGR